MRLDQELSRLDSSRSYCTVRYYDLNTFLLVRVHVVQDISMLLILIFICPPSALGGVLLREEHLANYFFASPSCPGVQSIGILNLHSDSCYSNVRFLQL